MNKILEKVHFSDHVVKLVVREILMIGRSRRAGHFVIVRPEEGESVSR